MRLQPALNFLPGDPANVYAIGAMSKENLSLRCATRWDKPACSADEIRLGLEILAKASRGVILSRLWTTKVMFRLQRCAGWSVPWLFTYGMNRFSHDVAHMINMTCVITICVFAFSYGSTAKFHDHLKCFENDNNHHLSHVMRKPVFAICEQSILAVWSVPLLFAA